MDAVKTVGQDRNSRRLVSEQLSLLNEQIDALVDQAPVMMHVVNQESEIVGVNQQWLKEMGYRKQDVVGRAWTEFLTVESRARIVANVLPLCLQVGKVRSVGVDLVRRDSRVLHRLFDGDRDGSSGGKGYRYAAFFDPHQGRQWAQASTTLSAIVEMIRIRGSVEGSAPYTPNSRLNLRGSGAQQIARPEAPTEQTHLTRKEMEVLARLAKGATNAEIAEHFSLTLNTVKFHVENIFQKLDVSNRTQAVSVGREQGFLS